MTENNVVATAEQVPANLNPNQAYLQDLLNKFNADPNDPTLDDTTKVLLGQVILVQQDVSKFSKQIEDLNAEIKERQDKGNQLLQQVIHKQGESQGYVNALLKLRK
jgi:peptidoglycan hydrolase CwlO-like protein